MKPDSSRRADSTGFQRVVGLLSILLTVFLLGNVITLFASVRNNTAALNDPALLASIGPAGAGMLHVSFVFDVIAYLLFAPIAVFCWMWFRSSGRGPVTLYTFFGLGYALLGSIGAVMLDAVLPNLIADYASAAPSRQELLQTLIAAFYRLIAHGIWNPLEVLLVSVWFLGIGTCLRRERRALGLLAMAIGAIGLIDPLGWILNNDTILNIGGIGTALILVWAVWFGVDLLRRPIALGQQ